MKLFIIFIYLFCFFFSFSCTTNPAMTHSLQTARPLKKGEFEITYGAGSIDYKVKVKNYNKAQLLALNLGLKYGVSDKFDLYLFANLLEKSELIPSLTGKYNIYDNKKNLAIALAPTYKKSKDYYVNDTHSFTLPVINSYHLFNDNLSLYLTPQYQYIYNNMKKTIDEEDQDDRGPIDYNKRVALFFTKKHTHLLGYMIGTRIHIGWHKNKIPLF